MKNVRLNNGVMMPAIGFGVFQIPENETERAVNLSLIHISEPTRP